MSDLSIQLQWHCAEPELLPGKYSNTYTVQFDAGFSVDAAEMEKLQDRAHRYCFIANTLADSVEINVL